MGWEINPVDGGGIDDAPTDGKTYGRKDAAWAEVVSAALAVDIVAASALPLPDVWAPLSDSLRLITGYGRDVLVGSDVVARMVNFSRSSTATYIGKDGQLKTAAANEPRFEKEGLLIEGQSTNLVVQSETLPRMLEAGAYTISPSAVQGYNLHSCVYNSGDDALVVDTGATLQAADGTVSFVFNSATIVGNWSCHVNNTDSYVGLWPKNSSVFAYADLGNGLIRVSRKLKGTTLNTLHFRCVQVAGSRIDIGCYQIEDLPFASSYIPTNGAAVTRAADVCWIQNALNVGPDAPVGDTAINFALAFESDFKRTTGITAPSICGIAPSANLLASQRRASLENDGILSLWCGAKTTYGISGRGVAVICKRGAESICSYNGSIQKAPFIYGYAGSHLALETGHVRNIRIWLNALTDEQIKAIK